MLRYQQVYLFSRSYFALWRTQPEAIDNVVANIREAGEKATLQVKELARASGVKVIG